MKPHGQHFLLFTGLLLAAAAVAVPARADQFVLLDLTYEATAQNTTDSHFPGMPAANIPKNLKSPIDYSTGSVYVRFEVLTKPSAAETLYNICFQNPSNYACLPYPPSYTATGVYNFNTKFSALWQVDMVDWTMGVSEVQLILKDKTQAKVQGDAMFYPYKTHVTITLVSPGATYVPPDMPAAGTGGSPAAGTGGAGTGSAGKGGSGGMGGRTGAAGSRAGAGGAGAGGSTASSDAGSLAAAGSPGSATGSENEAGAAAPGNAPDAGSAEGPSGADDTSSDPGSTGQLLPQGVTEEPNKRAPPPGNIEAGCSTVVPLGHENGARELAALSCLVALVGAERSRRRRSSRRSRLTL